MDGKKMDRRVRKTRNLLLNGLIQLMKEKDINDISVKELSDLADINRGTFYLHYNDIYDMLNKIEDELFVEFEGILDRDISTGKENAYDPEKTLLDIFTFLESHRELAKVMIGAHGDLTFVNRLKDLVEQRLEKSLEQCSDKPEYSYYPPFIISGFIGIIETWLDHPDPQSPEEMATICGNLLKNAIIRTE